MTKNDVEKLFTLLETLCPREPKKPRDAATVGAWLLVLEPYTYEAVRAAAVARARENRFSPDPAELVSYLPDLPAVEPMRGVYRDKTVEALRESWRELLGRRADAGIPATVTQARTAGLDLWTWLDGLDAAGLGLEAAHG